MRTYFTCEGETVNGPYTIFQMRSMWTSGRLHGGMNVRDSRDDNWKNAMEFKTDFEISENPIIGILICICGFIGSALSLIVGIFFFLAGKNAMQETTAAIYLVGGGLAMLVSILAGFILVRK